MIDNKDSLWEKIAGKLHGELNSEENAEFEETMTQDSQRRQFEKAETIKAELEKVGLISEEEKIISWNKVEKGIKSRQLGWIMKAMKYAALIIVAFVAGNLMRMVPPANKELGYAEVHVPKGQMSQLTLSDGTEIWLNSGTTLRYPTQFGEKTRTVRVIGEAFFKVAKMPEKPFIVNSTDFKIEVLGTSFNLSAYQEDCFSSVTLVEGKVSILDNVGKTIAKLQPGQMATKAKSTNVINISNVKTLSYSSWTEGKIYFDDERLDLIAFKLERWFNVEISFDDPQLKARKFTGTILKNKPVDQIMKALEMLAPIKFHYEINTTGKDKITIYKRT